MSFNNTIIGTPSEVSKNANLIETTNNFATKTRNAISNTTNNLIKTTNDMISKTSNNLMETTNNMFKNTTNMFKDTNTDSLDNIDTYIEPPLNKKLNFLNNEKENILEIIGNYFRENGLYILIIVFIFLFLISIFSILGIKIKKENEDKKYNKIVTIEKFKTDIDYNYYNKK